MRFSAVLTGIGLMAVGFLVGCQSESSPQLHEVYLYGVDDMRLTYAYGGPTQLTLEDAELSLEEGRVDDPLAVNGTLLIEGKPYLQETVPARSQAPFEVERIPLTTDLIVRVNERVAPVLYFDGSMWFTLLESAEPGFRARVAPRLHVGRLHGMGELTVNEADVLARALEARGDAFAVAALQTEDVPMRSIDGLSEHLRTGLYVQQGLSTDVTAFTPPPESLFWEVLVRGDQASGFDDPTFVIVADQGDLLSLWNRAFGSRLSIPPVPTIDFSRETVLAVFLGTRPTAGYGIEIEDLRLEDGDIFVDMREVMPPADSLTAQVLTSPWIMVRVLRGGIDVAWFRDSSTDTLLGVARRVQ
jgi:hypothetical protein